MTPLSDKEMEDVIDRVVNPERYSKMRVLRRKLIALILALIMYGSGFYILYRHDQAWLFWTIMLLMSAFRLEETGLK